LYIFANLITIIGNGSKGKPRRQKGTGTGTEAQSLYTRAGDRHRPSSLTDTAEGETLYTRHKGKAGHNYKKAPIEQNSLFCAIRKQMFVFPQSCKYKAKLNISGGICATKYKKPEKCKNGLNKHTRTTSDYAKPHATNIHNIHDMRHLFA